MDSMKFGRLCRRVVSKKDELNQSRTMAKYAIKQFVQTSLNNLNSEDAIRAGSLDDQGRFLEGEFVERSPTELPFVLQVRVGLEDKYEFFYLPMEVIVEAGNVLFHCETAERDSIVPTNNETMNRNDTMSAVNELLGPALEIKVDEYFVKD